MRTRKFTLATYLALSVLIAFGGVSSCGGGGGGNSSRGPGDSIIIVPPPNRAPAMTQDLAPATTEDKLHAPPEILEVISNQTIDVGDSLTLNLSNYFTDPDEATLAFVVESSSRGAEYWDCSGKRIRGYADDPGSESWDDDDPGICNG